MNADAFRHLYAYHFRANRKIWDECVVVLSPEQFVQPHPYSIGSIRNHVVHLLAVDDRWFSGLRGEEWPPFPNVEDYADREVIRQMWDAVEAKMQGFLATLTDADLLQFAFPNDPRLGGKWQIWQVLIHVANHGTDHRAQLLRLLHEQGAPTFGQDYFYYIMGRM